MSLHPTVTPMLLPDGLSGMAMRGWFLIGFLLVLFLSAIIAVRVGVYRRNRHAAHELSELTGSDFGAHQGGDDTIGEEWWGQQVENEEEPVEPETAAAWRDAFLNGDIRDGTDPQSPAATPAPEPVGRYGLPVEAAAPTLAPPFAAAVEAEEAPRFAAAPQPQPGPVLPQPEPTGVSMPEPGPFQVPAAPGMSPEPMVVPPPPVQPEPVVVAPPAFQPEPVFPAHAAPAHPAPVVPADPEPVALGTTAPVRTDVTYTPSGPVAAAPETPVFATPSADETVDWVGDDGGDDSGVPSTWWHKAIADDT